MSDLHYLEAAEAIRRFWARELSPVELMEAVIARTEQVEPTVNALSERHFDEALAQARAAEVRYGRGGGLPRPLEGLPVALKDSVPIAGRPWSHGSLAYRDAIAQATSPVAERIIEAGGIVHARTTAPEFGCAGFTHSRLWGVTRNPWDPTVTAGGSSGGSAAALASGAATLATGSDIGGSIRVPASLNGVVGFKPPYGRVPIEPPSNLDTYLHVGAMARTVADCALLQNALAGPHPIDSVSLRPKLEIPVELGSVAGMRIALSPDLGGWPLDPEVRANTLAAADVLRAAGAIVQEVDLTLSRTEVQRAVAIHWSTGFTGWIESEIERHGDLLTPYAIDLPRWCRELAAGGSVIDGHALEAKVQTALMTQFERYDVLLCATVGARGLVAGDDYVGHSPEIGGRPTAHYLDSFLTMPFNVAGRCPVLSVPSGFADNGVPTGIQLVGRPYEDVSVFRVAAAYEQASPWTEWPVVAAVA